jgi:hypothetical protein
MKNVRILLVLAAVVSGWVTSFAQEQVSEAEVPGDHFSLEGALELFKKSGSPEEFEKMLNSADSKVNNLDLNGDGYIDYIRVFDKYEGNVHAFIIQAVVSDTENQDVAVIELEKLANGKAVLQIIGDEDIYGVETIIEPTQEVRTYAGTQSTQTVVNVWSWPSVQYVYAPYYTVWSSPWGWHARPVWWHTWRPIVYVHYHSYWRPYRPYYSHCHTHRIAYAHRVYRPYRTTSVIVHNRHHTQVAHYRSTRHSDDRNGRTRNDERRSSLAGDRSSTIENRDRSKGSSTQRNTLTSSDRSSSRSRSTTIDRERNLVETKRNNSDNNTVTGAMQTGRETRQPVNRPELENKKRAIENTDTRQREISREQNVRHSPTEIKNEDMPGRRSGSVSNNREIRPQVSNPSENRNRSVENTPMRQRSSDRSPGSVHNSRSTSPQVSNPSGNRSRSLESPSSHQRSSNRSAGEIKPNNTKRGRH